MENKNILLDEEGNYTNRLYEDKTYKIIGACMEVHRTLGRGLLEVVYKDALCHEFMLQDIPFERERKYEITYKSIILPHYYFADFVVFDQIILEIKAQSGIVDAFHKQVINYLAISKHKLGLLVNFGEDSLQYKRLIL